MGIHESHRTNPASQGSDWFALVDSYVDGTLDEKSALRLHLAAQKDPALAAELERTRAFFSALEAAPVAEPSARFDAAVLSRLPLERYATAPRKAPRTLVLGATEETVAERAARPLGRGLLAGAVAYVLVLLVGRSALQSGLTRGAAVVDDALADLATRTATTPVLSDLVVGVDRVYDAIASGVAAAAVWMGPSLATVLFGLLLGATVLWPLARRSSGMPERGAK